LLTTSESVPISTRSLPLVAYGLALPKKLHKFFTGSLFTNKAG
jgi:hypothetical protein